MGDTERLETGYWRLGRTGWNLCDRRRDAFHFQEVANANWARRAKFVGQGAPRRHLGRAALAPLTRPRSKTWTPTMDAVVTGYRGPGPATAGYLRPSGY